MLSWVSDGCERVCGRWAWWRNETVRFCTLSLPHTLHTLTRPSCVRAQRFAELQMCYVPHNSTTKRPKNEFSIRDSYNFGCSWWSFVFLENSTGNPDCVYTLCVCVCVCCWRKTSDTQQNWAARVFGTCARVRSKWNPMAKRMNGARQHCLGESGGRANKQARAKKKIHRAGKWHGIAAPKEIRYDRHNKHAKIRTCHTCIWNACSDNVAKRQRCSKSICKWNALAHRSPSWAFRQSQLQFVFVNMNGFSVYLIYLLFGWKTNSVHERTLTCECNVAATWRRWVAQKHSSTTFDRRLNACMHCVHSTPSSNKPTRDVCFIWS